jgi:hypothetical protein
MGEKPSYIDGEVHAAKVAKITFCNFKYTNIFTRTYSANTVLS